MEEYDVVIVGAGAAGLSAGIYAARSGLRAVIMEEGLVGGQTNLSPNIPNYPGFPNIPGMELTQKMREHALQYVQIKEGVGVKKIEQGEAFTLTTDAGQMTARTIILATGAKHRTLGIQGEERLVGKGVSYCATCDGFFFKDRKVLTVGGGNTAVQEALYLKGVGADVTLVHRRSELRAEKALQEKLFELGAGVMWDTVLVEIIGETGVTGVRVKNAKTGEEREVQVDGVFIAVGIQPNAELAKQLGVRLRKDGYIETDRQMRCDMPGIFAAGDLTGGLKQVVTAVAEGAQAAISAFEYIQNPYWKEKGVDWS